MPQITFKKNLPAITVSRGVKLMDALLAAGLPVASSCIGKGVCSKCRIEICAGQQHLSAETGAEKILRERNNVGDQYRISCQTEVLGDITIDTSYW